MTLRRDPDTGLWCRPGTTDRTVVRSEIRAYDPLLIDERDVVLDVGANIGGFARWAVVDRGAGRLVCYEPERENFSLLEKNVTTFDTDRRRCEIHRAALVGPGVELSDVRLYINRRSSSRSIHSVEKIRGREPVSVPAERFRDVVTRVRSTVVKIDIEGGEYGVLSGYAWPWHVREVAIEYHIIRSAWQEDAYALDDRFIDQGFQRVVSPSLERRTRWTAIGIYRRS